MEEVAAKPATEAQWKFLRTLAGQVPGDGLVRLAAYALVNDPVTTVAASAEIARLKTEIASSPKAPPTAPPARPVPITPLAPTASGHATTNAPAGRYAVMLPGNQGDLLVEVTKPTEGVWAGRTFVKTVSHFGEVAPEPIRGREAILVLNAIETDPHGCSGQYGRITGRCGLCNRRLSGPGISLGIGPECLGKFSHMDRGGYRTP